MIDTRPTTAATRPEGATGAALARFLEARGKRVCEGAGALWATYRWPFWISLPYERHLDPDPGELARTMRRERMAAVRYPTSQQGWPSGLYVCTPRTYSLASVERRHRGQVKHGLACCELRRIDPDQLLAEGLALNRDTMERQRRFDREFGDAAGWRRFVAAVRACAEVSVLGALIDGRLSAYAVTCRDGAWLHVLHKMSRTSDLIHRTNVALDFWLLTEAAKDDTVAAVEAGFTSLVSGEGLHRYKLIMGYEVAPHQLGLRFHPAAAPIATSGLSVRIASALAARRPSSRRLELVANVLKGAHLCTSGDAAPTAPARCGAPTRQHATNGGR